MRILILLFCFAAVAPNTADAGDSAERRAKKHKKAGLRYLEKERYDRAIEELTRAHELSKEAILLFHLGEAYNAKEDYAQALAHYKAFRDAAPEEASKRNVDAIIEALSALVGEPVAPEPEPGPEPQPEPEPEPEPQPQPEPQPEPQPVVTPVPPRAGGSSGGGGGKRIGGIVVGVAGVLAAGAGGYFARVAQDRSDRISELFAGEATWSDEHTRLYDEGEAAEQRAIILFAAGGAAIVTGAVLYYLGVRDGRATIEVAPTAGGAGATVGVGWEL